MSDLICPYCTLDSAGRHEVFCPGAVHSYTLAAQPLNVLPYPLVRSDWIWCDERLPDQDEADVLVFWTHPYVLSSEPFISVGWISSGTWYCHEVVEGTAIAWQPLPEPPSAEQIAAYRKRITVDPTP